MDQKKNIFAQTKEVLIGGAKNFRDPNIFHKISLIALMAWIGLGSDGMSSSCYGPEEAFLALNGHHSLGIFVALASVITIIIISLSYSQLIELFPSGGGGYLVASKLLSPQAGVVSGSALIIDYILTISISIASGSDALFSFLPENLQQYKFAFAICGVILLMVLNLRGIKESIAVISPIFMVFIATHAVMILYAFAINAGHFSEVVSSTAADIRTSGAALGTAGMIFLILRAYSMGAGTFTGIEAVSNGINVFANPKVKNAKTTMLYMAASLSFLVVGITFAYVLFKVVPQSGKTLNAVLFETVAKGWGNGGKIFVLITLISEAALLFIAAQTGFIDGPRVIANMANDRWMPSRFAMLSDRLVAQNGILIMSAAAIFTLIISKGSVQFLVVLYSINVFITFSLSQLGMVIHWWQARKTGEKWKRKIFVSLVGFIMTSFILIAMTFLKFMEGGWITILITLGLIMLCFYIKKHYNRTRELVLKLDTLIETTAINSPEMFDDSVAKKLCVEFDCSAKTAVVFVNGFNGLGLHTTLSVNRLMKDTFRNFVFVQIGVLDTGNFSNREEMQALQKRIDEDAGAYVEFMTRNGYNAETFTAIGTEVVEEANKLVKVICEKYTDPVFFGGQIVFKEETFINELLHNYIVFKLQQSFYYQGITFVILPIRVDND
jgi:amino acid transporter